MNLDHLARTLREDEGWREFAYKDTEGYLTIGYGFLIDSRRGAGLPRAIGEEWLRFNIKDSWERLVAARPWIADQPEEVQQALGNMAYQMGVIGLLGFRRMLAALEAGNRIEAAREAIDSRWADQTPERATRIALMIRGEP